jgi:hypothetical protein
MMRLLDLDPRWLTYQDRRVGFVFRCPLPASRDWWQTCFVEPFNTFKGPDGRHHWDGEHHVDGCQAGIVSRCCPEALGRYQLCTVGVLWVVVGGIENASFETLTVTPSLDGSRGGLWHGYVTNGQIVGGI